jgi:hypothetical protein
MTRVALSAGHFIRKLLVGGVLKRVNQSKLRMSFEEGEKVLGI